MGKMLGMEEGVLKIPQARTMAVTVRKLDSISGNLPAPDILKIDVEGCAGLVLEGAMHTIQKYKPLIFMEFHGPEERQAVSRVLRELEYEIHDLKNAPVLDIANTPISPVWCTKKKK